ncbi:MAG: CocE/NonD family hydrolase [Actinomycetota bacterium]
MRKPGGITQPLMALAIAAGLVLTPAVTPAGAEENPPPKTTKGKSQAIYTERVTEPYRIETKHGLIYGEVVRPVVPSGVKVPVILTYSPYNIMGSPSNQAASEADDSVASYFVPRGYARAVFDVVGTRESSGCYDYGGIRERETGAAVVEFLGTRDWSNGKVGMIGGSYDGTTQLAIAVEAPPHLTAIIPQVAIDRWYDYAYGQGVRYFMNSENTTDEGFDTPAGFDFGFGFIPPADVSDPQAYADALSTRVNPCERIQHTQRGYDPDPVYDDFWKERDYRMRASKVKAAVFFEGGWLDHNVKHWDTIRFYQALSPNVPKKLVMGQWNHSSSQFKDAQDIRHAWFDHWLLGLDTGVMRLPKVDSELNTGKRVQLDSWPPAGTRTVELKLVSGAEAKTGELALTGAASSSWQDLNIALTEDQMFQDQCQGACVIFLGAPTKEDVRISGAPLLNLAATSSAVSTHFTPVLFDEAPDGTRSVITRGFLNSRNRDGLDKSTDVTPGVEYTAPVDMWDTDWLMPAGHRLGVAISSANAIWALPDTERSTNTLSLGGASFLRLPVSEGAVVLGAVMEHASTESRINGRSALPATGGGLAAAVLALLGAGGLRRLGRA